MDISTEKNNGYKPRIAHTFLGIILWLIGFFTLTEEDRFEAGIYIDKHGE